MRYSDIKAIIYKIGRYLVERWDAEQWEVAETLIDGGYDAEDVASCVDNREYVLYEDIEEYIDEYIENYITEKLPSWLAIDYTATWEGSLRHEPYLFKLDNGRILDAYGMY